MVNDIAAAHVYDWESGSSFLHLSSYFMHTSQLCLPKDIMRWAAPMDLSAHPALHALGVRSPPMVIFDLQRALLIVVRHEELSIRFYLRQRTVIGLARLDFCVSI